MSERFKLWFANSPIASAVKGFAAVVVALAVAEWTATGVIGFDKWQTWVIAALAAAVVPVVNALNPSDHRYGVSANSFDDAGPDGDYL